MSEEAPDSGPFWDQGPPSDDELTLFSEEATDPFGLAGEEAPPTAIRPIGQLGGEEAVGVALGYSSPPSEPPADDVTADGAPPSGHTMELHDATDLDPALPFRRQGAELPFRPGPVTPVTPTPVESGGNPSTTNPSIDIDPTGAWPFESRETTPVLGVPAPAPAEPFVRPPNPLKEPPPVVAPWLAPIAEQPPADSAPSQEIPLEIYARVRVATWQRDGDLLRALAEHGIDEIDWRRHERRQASRIADEAREGRSELAERVREALRAARAERAGQDGDEELLMLEEYAFIRAQLDDKDDEARVTFLAEEGLTPDLWDRMCNDWAARARRDPSVAKRVRRAIAEARQRRRARRGDDG